MRKIAIAMTSTLLAAASYADSPLTALMSDSKTQLDWRYRFEGVEQAGVDNNAAANTLRTRLTFVSGAVSGVAIGVEFDDLRHLGNDEFNSTDNGKLNYPVVADPRGTDLNQLYAKYQSGSFVATGGRQRINLDDQRFVGGVAWRQNEQTYDAVRLRYVTAQFSADYSYVAQVNRIFGPAGDKASMEGDTHLINGAWQLSKRHKLAAFFYDMDFDDASTSSNQTYGLRYQGSFEPLSLVASYASQSETGGAGLDYNAVYYLLEAEITVASFTLTGGYEVLGSDGGQQGFQTPLATAHKFQGFADTFLTTPTAGIKDAYLGAAAPLGPIKLALTYHDFQADAGGDSYGSEWDLVATYAITPQLTALAKLADYSADGYGSDTQKFWLQVQLSL